ncbi:MAG TPA: glycosyltransferase [Candidatus Elarobacter sp.]|jgi:1,2-diacylglycerol 3-beta-galactosyltransferase|nr:glycosyltransferase [Candidatus Elarobacter sp.]
MTKRALFLISDTGGGHRAGAQAVGAALDEIDGPTRFEWRIDDIATHCTFPLSKLGPAYSAALRYAPPIYGALYHATNGRRRYKTIVRFCEPLYRERLREVFTQYQPDVIVSVHPLLNHAALRARADAGMQHVPIVTVITDLGRVHEGWLLPEADLTVVPAREVYQRAIERGVPPERLRLLGHPIHPRFEDVSGTKAEIRKKLGLPEKATIALLMAGGEGGGKLLPTTLGLARAGLDFHLVVVTGRNAALKAKLEELAPSLPTPMTVLGFRHDVPELMRAADLLVTKAGPGTIAEASVAEVPVVVYDYVPGQERGNLDYVRTNGIGVVALSTAEVVSSVARIVHNQERLAKMRSQQTAIAPRGSSRRIAELIAQIATNGRRPTIPAAG